MMMSCKTATYLLSQQLDQKLTTKEKLLLRFHLLICSGCTNFKGNITFLHKACEHISSDKDNG
jgi:predicted anti-sigma-YlaC factor YlaD